VARRRRCIDRGHRQPGSDRRSRADSFVGSKWDRRLWLFGNNALPKDNTQKLLLGRILHQLTIVVNTWYVVSWHRETRFLSYYPLRIALQQVSAQLLVEE
jgi:hypothetical protein